MIRTWRKSFAVRATFALAAKIVKFKTVERVALLIDQTTNYGIAM